jgi:osmoprotectant transport system permease protein
VTWLANNWPEVLRLTVVHLTLVIPSVVVSAFIAVPLGLLAARQKRIRGGVLGVVGALYAVPALPLFVLIPVVTGIPLRSPANVVIVLTLYGTALMVRTAADAFGTGSAMVRDAAVAVGHTSMQRFWRVELPLASPVLLAGIRVVVVGNVSLATVGALIGVPSLGGFLTDGFQRGIIGEVVTGVGATVILALVLDACCVALASALLPWTRRSRGWRS